MVFRGWFVIVHVFVDNYSRVTGTKILPVPRRLQKPPGSAPPPFAGSEPQPPHLSDRR